MPHSDPAIHMAAAELIVGALVLLLAVSWAYWVEGRRYARREKLRRRWDNDPPQGGPRGGGKDEK